MEKLQDINIMSVDSYQQSQQGKQKLRIQNVYKKIEKAHENMQSFQQMLTKFSTHKKNSQDNQKIIPAFSIESPSFRRQDQQKPILSFSGGWQYSGQIFEQKFHGFGNLMLNGESLYVGEFKNGKMNGMGKLKYNEVFDELINIEGRWLKYQGQFYNGIVTGFGNLYLEDNQILIGYFIQGRTQYYTKIEKQQLLNSE